MAVSKLKKWIAYLNNKTGEKAFLMNILETNKHYLKSGKYGFTFTDKRKIYLKDKNANEFLLRNKEQANQFLLGQLKFAIDFLTSNLITADIVNEENFGVKGDLIMVTYSQNVKIFDFSKKLILNKFTDDLAAYYNIKLAHQTLSNHLNMAIIEFIDTETAYVEKYLEFIPYKEWDKKWMGKCIEEIYKSYQHYYSSVSKEQVAKMNVLPLLNELRLGPYGNHKIFDELKRIFGETDLEAVFPVIRVHGDMKFENILLCEEEFFFIDLEFSSEFFFFYDVMNFSFIEALKGDSSFLDSYLNGDFDVMLQNLFAEFDIKFEKDYKLFYLAVYIIDRFYHFDMQMMKGRLDMETVLEQYFAVVDKAVRKCEIESVMK